MHRGKTQSKAILAGFVILGSLVLGLSLPSQAADKFLGETIVPSNPHYIENKADYKLKQAVKMEIALSPFVDGSGSGLRSGMEWSR